MDRDRLISCYRDRLISWLVEDGFETSYAVKVDKEEEEKLVRLMESVPSGEETELRIGVVDTLIGSIEVKGKENVVAKTREDRALEILQWIHRRDAELEKLKSTLMGMPNPRFAKCMAKFRKCWLLEKGSLVIELDELEKLNARIMERWGAVSSESFGKLDAQKQMIGDKLYPIIADLGVREKEAAGKITGMLLELDNDELLVYLDNKKALMVRVQEALETIDAHRANSASKKGEERESKKEVDCNLDALRAFEALGDADVVQRAWEVLLNGPDMRRRMALQESGQKEKESEGVLDEKTGQCKKARRKFNMAEAKKQVAGEDEVVCPVRPLPLGTDERSPATPAHIAEDIAKKNEAAKEKRILERAEARKRFENKEPKMPLAMPLPIPPRAPSAPHQSKTKKDRQAERAERRKREARTAQASQQKGEVERMQSSVEERGSLPEHGGMLRPPDGGVLLRDGAPPRGTI